MSDDLISRQALYEKTAEWEAQALHMVEKTMNDEDLTEWRKWSIILKERSAFKFDIADAPSVERKEGRWKGRGFGDYECTICWGIVNGKTRYCPHCGAIME